MVDEQKQWDLVTISPGFVLGPSLTTRVDSTSIDFMISMLNGKFKYGVPELYFGIVDVRDVAKAHILAGTNPQASGRHILVADTLKMLDIARILREKNGQYPLPKSEVPKFLLYLFGPFQGFSWKYISRNVGVPMQFDNSYSKQDLGIEYTSIKNTLHDHVQQIIESELVEKHEQT
jgi:nucleoside-diphosphate-sugar epimerase